jgi:hypothetical protein
MTATYQKHGLQFLYPENWRLSDEGWPELPCSISLESPDGSAFWSVHFYELASDPDEILKNTLDTLRETYPDLEISDCPADSTIPRESGVEAMFYCLDFLIRIRLEVVRLDRCLALFWYQAEDRQFEQLEMVFQAIGISLIRHTTLENDV